MGYEFDTSSCSICWANPVAPTPIFACVIAALVEASWKLPLAPEGGLEPVDSTRLPEQRARREAAAKLIGNRDAVVRFALRGVGVPGIPGVSAELSDPSAQPNDTFKEPIDAALRYVCDEGRDTSSRLG